MQKLFVYADFDWLDKPLLIGELSCDSVRGNEIYGFSFDNEWLAKYGDIFLSDDLQNYTGTQYTRSERDIFACFSDALPDRWGRTLLNRREQIAAADEKEPCAVLPLSITLWVSMILRAWVVFDLPIHAQANSSTVRQVFVSRHWQMSEN